MKYVSLLFIAFLVSCKPSQTKLSASQIIDKTIVASGANKGSNSEITFHFRDKNYAAIRKNGTFKLSRSFKNESGNIEDVLTNKGFERFVNSEKVAIPEAIATKYSNSVNSVHYFSVLPFGLDAKAVHKKLLPSATIKGKAYYKIEITFSEEGGGEDFDDVFIYWIGQEDYLIDYFGYSYHTNGGGKRFRAIKKSTIKNGIRFVNYDNYEPKNKSLSFIDIDKAFEKDALKKISEIVLEDIQVKILD